MKRLLTEQERLLIAGYQYEMTGDEDGPATVGWLVKHNLSHADMHPFTMQLTRELDAEGCFTQRGRRSTRFLGLPWRNFEPVRGC